jgi:hypothetical protein
MSRFECMNGHRGPAYGLVLKPSIAPLAGDVLKACPQCGADVRITPCNKHGGKVPSQRSGAREIRRPFVGGMVSLK